MNVQINFQVPLERNASLRTLAPSGYGGYLSAGNNEGGGTLTPLPEIPECGGFFSDANGFAIAQHASDFSPVTPENPAHPGETIVAYANDFFPVWPSPPVGFPAPLQPLFQILPANLSFIRGAGYLYLQRYPRRVNPSDQSYASTPALETPFEGLAPGLIGVEQINFVVPKNQQPGDWDLFYNKGSCPDGVPPPGRCSPTASSSPSVKLPVR